MGRNTTAMGVLLMKAEAVQQASISASSTRGSRSPPKRTIACPTRSTAPVRVRPAERTNMAPTVTSASLPNAWKASRTSSAPPATSATTTTSAVLSADHHSFTNAISAATATANTKYISAVRDTVLVLGGAGGPG